MTTKNQRARGTPNRSSLTVNRLMNAIIATAVIAALIAGFTITKREHETETLDPNFEFVDFRDASLSFSQAQMKAELGVHDAVYDACFGGSPVQYSCYAFGGNLVEVGSAVTVSADETWPILDRVTSVDANATRFSPAIEKAIDLAKAKPKRVFGVLFQSDGDATDWEEFDQAAKKLAKQKNIAFVAITGATPGSRIRLRKAMKPMGDRFLACDSTDTNTVTAAKLAAFVNHARGNP